MEGATRSALTEDAQITMFGANRRQLLMVIRSPTQRNARSPTRYSTTVRSKCHARCSYQSFRCSAHLRWQRWLVRRTGSCWKVEATILGACDLEGCDLRKRRDGNVYASVFGMVKRPGPVASPTSGALLIRYPAHVRGTLG